ncbi:hypothetical protein Trydic_g20914 [Trypoxylus dichotomus]
MGPVKPLVTQNPWSIPCKRWHDKVSIRALIAIPTDHTMSYGNTCNRMLINQKEELGLRLEEEEMVELIFCHYPAACRIRFFLFVNVFLIPKSSRKTLSSEHMKFSKKTVAANDSIREHLEDRSNT